MGYIPVKQIENVSIGQNYVYNGVIFIRKSRSSDVVYACIDDKYYKFSKDGFEESIKFRNKLYEYGTRTRNVIGRFMAFKLMIRGRAATYLTISYKESNAPILIFQSVSLGLNKNGNESANIHFCYNPEKNENGPGYIGTIGSISSDLYNTVYNKSKLLTQPIPRVDYVEKAVKLKSSIEASEYIPFAYKPDHEDIIIEDVFPQEMNKLHLLSKLKYIIEDYGNSTIYYSGSLKEIDRKYKAIVRYFKQFKNLT